jgi:Fic family protein
MIFDTPTLTEADVAVLAAIEDLRTELRFYLHEPRRWFGTLRRATFARAVQGSNSIEGYHASVEDVAAVIEGEEPLDASEETRQAIAGYRDAMTYVLQLAGQRFVVDESLVKSLHFMMMKYDLGKRPGQWRPGGIWVEDQEGRAVYAAPDAEQVEPLMAELLADVNGAEGVAMVRGAMAHLNLTMIHPFSDGNGRMARCLQSLVLAGDGIISPEFSSIEEYLGRNTAAYYEVLGDIGQGRWQPDRSARPWVRFCLTAHLRQAGTLVRRVRETEALWDRCEQLAHRHALPDRCVGALCEAARGWRLRRSLYIKVVRSSSGETITDATATRDLRAIVAAGLLDPQGERRGRQYTPTPELRTVWNALRRQRPPRGDDDPYAELAQPSLPGIER